MPRKHHKSPPPPKPLTISYEQLIEWLLFGLAPPELLNWNEFRIAALTPPNRLVGDQQFLERAREWLDSHRVYPLG